MYNCEIHGTKEVGWCEECGKLIRCDCSTTETDNGYVDYADFSRSVEVLVSYCPVCLDIKDVCAK